MAADAGAAMQQADLSQATVDELLVRLGDASALPGAGVAAALSASAAAGLVEMATRAPSPGWEAAGVAVQAKLLRASLRGLADDNLAAYCRALAALADARTRGPLADAAAVGRAMAESGAALLLVAGRAADVVALAEEVADHCDPDLRADVVAAAILAEGALRAAAALARANLIAGSEPFGDEHLPALAHSAAVAVRRMSEPG